MFSAPSSEDEADQDADDDQSPEDKEIQSLLQSFLLQSLLAAQHRDLVSSLARPSASHRARLARLDLDADKTLLQLLAAECRAGGEERGMRALEVVRLMRDRSGRMLEAASKVAERYGRGLLGEKIRELAERVVGGEEDEEEDEE
jgi:chromosome transmission fidelity protein 4